MYHIVHHDAAFITCEFTELKMENYDRNRMKQNYKTKWWKVCK